MDSAARLGACQDTRRTKKRVAAVIIALDLSAVRPGMTGIGRYAQTLAQTLPAGVPGHEYVLVSPPTGGAWRCSADLPSLPGIQPSGDPEWYQFGLPGELEAWEVDLYHSPFFACPLIKVCRYVVTLHDVIPLAAPEYSQPEFTHFFERRARPCLELADHVVTVSEFSRRDILKHIDIPAEKVSVVPECVSPSFYPKEGERVDSVLRDFGIPTSYILYVGSLEPRKNLDSLVRAYSRLSPETMQGLCLVIAGPSQRSGLDADRLADELGIREHVILLGHVADEDLPRLYRQARMFAFLSRYEGFGLPVLEAMASGVPVITSSATSLPEVAGDAALFVDPNDVDGLSAAIRLLDTDEETRRRLIDGGRLRAAHFSPDRLATAIRSVYDSTAGTT